MLKTAFISLLVSTVTHAKVPVMQGDYTVDHNFYRILVNTSAKAIPGNYFGFNDAQCKKLMRVNEPSLAYYLTADFLKYRKPGNVRKGIAYGIGNPWEGVTMKYGKLTTKRKVETGEILIAVNTIPEMITYDHKTYKGTLKLKHVIDRKTNTGTGVFTDGLCTGAYKLTTVLPEKFNYDKWTLRNMTSTSH